MVRTHRYHDLVFAFEAAHRERPRKSVGKRARPLFRLDAGAWVFFWFLQPM